MSDMNTQTPQATGEQSDNIDRVIWRPDLCKMIGVTSQSVRNWVKAGKLPKPDVDLSQRTQGWRLSTLRGAGIGLV